LEKAYKQVPGDVTTMQWMTIAVWDPSSLQPAYFTPLCQLFGGKSPPLNFARYAAWLCETAGPLFGLPLSHCVDDIICVEPAPVVESGHLAFKILCATTGWAISPNKAPPPSAAFLVIGVVLDLSKTPEEDAVLKVSTKRVAQLEKILNEVKRTSSLGPGAAASLIGK
jgi:hypothetical protein